MNVNSEILARFIEEDYGLKKEGSKWFRAVEKSSLTLDGERGIFYYNSENIVGDALVYLTKVRSMSFAEAKDLLKTFDYRGTLVYTINGKQEDVVVYPRLVDIFFEDGVNNRDYLYKRGIWDSTIDRFRVGWYNGFNMIPFYDEGAFRNFQMRKDDPVKTIRNYYRGVGALLFNSDILSIVDRVYYTEGPLDAMVLIQNGIPAISSTGGSAFKPEWYSKFINIKSIYILFDNDSAGVKEALRLADFLGTTRCKIYTFGDFEQQGYDPVDYFRDGYQAKDLLEIVDVKGKYSFELGRKS